MISYTELKGPQALLERAFRLLDLEPLSVLKSDLMEKEFHKSYHLFARDVYGIFGTATLTERPMSSLDVPLKEALTLKGQGTYYELSLLYATSPNSLENESMDPQEKAGNLSMRYCRFFYHELFDFLCRHLKDAHLVVTTTKIESEKMLCFGTWSFTHTLSKNGSFQGILDVPVKNHLPFEQRQKNVKKTARDIFASPPPKDLKEKNDLFTTKDYTSKIKNGLKSPFKPYKN